MIFLFTMMVVSLMIARNFLHDADHPVTATGR